MEQAEIYVYDFLDNNGVDTEEISDTGTVENLLDCGFSITQISEGRVPAHTILDNISWL